MAEREKQINVDAQRERINVTSEGKPENKVRTGEGYGQREEGKRGGGYPPKYIPEGEGP